MIHNWKENKIPKLIVEENQRREMINVPKPEETLIQFKIELTHSLVREGILRV